jgi:hypothetical protein
MKILFYFPMQVSKSKYTKNNLCNVKKVNMNNYRFYLPARVRNFGSAKPDFSSLTHSSGASLVPVMETLMVALPSRATPI